MCDILGVGMLDSCESVSIRPAVPSPHGDDHQGQGPPDHLRAGRSLTERDSVLPAKSSTVEEKANTSTGAGCGLGT
jgi:hypothetical protein